MASAFDVVAGRIRAKGPVSFAEYMEIVLYDPQVGFYARPRAGRERDFSTSPLTTPEFGRLLARGLQSMWRALGEPRPFVVVEGGAGAGELARAVVANAGDVPFSDALRYRAVEQGEAARSSITAPKVSWHAGLDEAPSASVVVANELLDNLVARRFVIRRGEALELLVDVRNGRLHEVDGPPLNGDLARFVEDARRRRVEFEEGQVGELRTGVVEWVQSAARLVRRGYMLFLDYGGASAEVFAHGDGSVKTYRGHRAGHDPFESPGECDVTVPVDFDLVARVAAGHGFQEVFRWPQRDLLLAFGAAERAASLSRARSPDDVQAWAGLREVLFGSPGTDITAQLLAKEAPPPSFVQSR